MISELSFGWEKKHTKFTAVESGAMMRVGSLLSSEFVEKFGNRGEVPCLYQKVGKAKVFNIANSTEEGKIGLFVVVFNRVDGGLARFGPLFTNKAFVIQLIRVKPFRPSHIRIGPTNKVFGGAVGVRAGLKDFTIHVFLLESPPAFGFVSDLKQLDCGHATIV
jgi:hypothetical protein